MLRRVIPVILQSARKVTAPNGYQISRAAMSAEVKKISDEEFDANYVAYFSRTDIDGWEVRKAMHDLHIEDLVPEPKIIIAALHACRRLNDYSLAVRYLETIHIKCGGKVAEIWPYILQEIQPTLTELGISTPAEMGYDKPELWPCNVFEEENPNK